MGTIPSTCDPKLSNPVLIVVFTGIRVSETARVYGPKNKTIPAKQSHRTSTRPTSLQEHTRFSVTPFPYLVV